MRVAIIGGTGLNDIAGIHWRDLKAPATAYGAPSATPKEGKHQDSSFIFLPRHGHKHSIAPHKINYLANMAALKALGVTHVLAVNAVGGLRGHLGPGVLAVPDQVIDYTWGRESSYCDGVHGPLDHIDFTSPYSKGLRASVAVAAKAMSISLVDGGVYGCTQGPRLESAAEVRRLQRDGCDLVGMTGMPEAALARELGIEYASLCLVVNWGAGMVDEPITLEQIHSVMSAGIPNVVGILMQAVKDFSG